MEKTLEKFKSNIPIIILIFYSLGYVYLNRFYSRFNISIENYINLTDIIFFAINSLIKITLLFFIIEIILSIISIFILKIYYLSEKDEKIKEEKIDTNLKYASFTIFIIFGFLLNFIIKGDIVIYFSYFFTFFLVKTFQITHFENKEDKKNMLEFLFIFLYLLLLISFAIWGYKDGNFTKDNECKNEIIFNENDKKFDTSSDTLNFIGETSLYVFLFDNKNRKSLIFQKDKIDNFKINDKSLTEKKEDSLSKAYSKKIDTFFDKINDTIQNANKK